MGENNRILYDDDLVQTMANFNLGTSNIYGGNFDFRTRVLYNILINVKYRIRPKKSNHI